MDETTILNELLTRAATDAVDTVDPPSPEYFSARRLRRRRTGWSVAVMVGVVALVAGTVYVAARPTSHPVAGPKPLPTQHGVTAQQLAHYKWTRLPDAPIAGRGDGVSLWTGTQFLVWGGAAGNRVFADGATYTPATGRWQKLPASPLSARSAPASVLADGSVFVWGGNTGERRVTDGALYDLRTHTWTSLPPAPVTSYDWAQAFWTGTEVALTSTSTNDSLAVHVDAFDLHTHRWSALPDLRLKPDHRLVTATALGAEATLYVWIGWSHVVGPATHRELDSGFDGYTFDTKDGHWTTNSLVPDEHTTIRSPLWTSRDIVIPAGHLWCGTCSLPLSEARNGSVIHPTTGVTSPIAHGPADDLDPEYTWTGRALLAYNTGTLYETSSGKGSHYPGEAAAWDPASNRWTQLTSAPLSGYEADSVWTGDRLLIWGSMDSGGRQAGKTGHPPLELTAGLQFGPP